MSHVTGTVQVEDEPIQIGPDSGDAPAPPEVWSHDFEHEPAPDGTRFLMLHFQNASFPADNRLEVDLGYGTDVFSSADGDEFWTRPVDVSALDGGLVPIRYVADGAESGSVELDRYGRGERHAGDQDPTALSNCDPFLAFLEGGEYVEPDYDPFWYCDDPPNWENITCVPDSDDVRRETARSVCMILTVHGDQLGSCSGTLVDEDVILTAGHCLTVEEALTSSVTFDYQVECDGSEPGGYEARFHRVTEVLERRYNSGGDYALLRIEVPDEGLGLPPIQMRHDIPAPGEQVFGLHHPNGAVKKLSIPHPAYDTVLGSGPSAITVHSNFHVSGGSSGSGLFDLAGRVAGILSNGDPCGNTGGVIPLRYYPTGSMLLDIAPAPPPPITRDVMVVFDRSGSMSLDDGLGRQKIEAARDAVSLFVQLVRAGTGNRIGLVSFSTKPSEPVDFAIDDVTGANKTALIGPAPYAGGVVGDLNPGGATTIGGGLEAGRLEFPGPGDNPRIILLLTDGLQNTPPMVEMVEEDLGEIEVNAIGFGAESSLNGELLTDLATEHDGDYVRAADGLSLEKFFSHAFGNIFEEGILIDPEQALPADQRQGPQIPFRICGEETLTVVTGWDDPEGQLFVQVETPDGDTINPGAPDTESATGRTWSFLRVPLPYEGERDGEWNARVMRPGGGGEFPPPSPELRYFLNVIPRGGPHLERIPDRTRYYTGDSINPLVQLRFSEGGFPHHAQVEVTVSRPDTSVGNVLTQSGLDQPGELDADTIPSRQTTIQRLEQESGRPVVDFTTSTFDLQDDPASTRGTFEPAGVFGRSLTDFLNAEGNYTFHFRATYGEECTSSRELLWSLHVDVGVDPSATDVTPELGPLQPEGTRPVTIVLVPRDVYGNHLGPGRAGSVEVEGTPGTTLTGPLQDNGDGSYTVTGTWDPDAGLRPGVVLTQDDRPPVTLKEPEPEKPDCRKWIILSAALGILALILLILLLAH